MNVPTNDITSQKNEVIYPQKTDKLLSVRQITTPHKYIIFIPSKEYLTTKIAIDHIKKQLILIAEWKKMHTPYKIHNHTFEKQKCTCKKHPQKRYSKESTTWTEHIKVKHTKRPMKTNGTMENEQKLWQLNNQDPQRKKNCSPMKN